MTTSSNTNRHNGSIKITAYLKNRGIIGIDTECDQTVLRVIYETVNIWTNKPEIQQILCSFYRNNIDNTLEAFRNKSAVLYGLTKDNRTDKSVEEAIATFIEDNWAVLRG